MSRTTTELIPYGCDSLGRLTHVLMHRPGNELELVRSSNHARLLFDYVPDAERFREEHDRYREMLSGHGVEVFELSDYVEQNIALIDFLPNLTYLHDTAVISARGTILSAMAWDSRKGEEQVVREALENLGIPTLIDFEDPDDAFEGCLLLSPETVLVAETERHSRASIQKFIRRALASFREVILVEVLRARRFMHPDTIYSRVSETIALAYLPAFKRSYVFTCAGVHQVDFAEYMRGRGVNIIEVSDMEQQRLACSFVPLEPGVIIHYDSALDRETRNSLTREGVEMLFFHPEALRAGGGSLRCITLRLHRDPT
ncbi:MAG: arginine deiminase [Dehalococcoidia bacterium]|nr:arginine deiminase [Dehalococcoidia bacterium]